jgi:hypothetical protein
MPINLTGFGHQNSVDVSSNTTLTLAAHSGIVVNVTATCTIALPATVIGQRFFVRVGAEGITVTISPDANDLIVSAGAANSGAGADNKDLIFTNQPAGSYVELCAITTTGFTVVRSLGTFTFES